jgi:hypothetical protein
LAEAVLGQERGLLLLSILQVYSDELDGHPEQGRCELRAMRVAGEREPVEAKWSRLSHAQQLEAPSNLKQ